MKPYSRLALGFSRMWENLEAAVNLHVANFNFCWRPGKMRITPGDGRWRRQPALELQRPAAVVASPAEKSSGAL